MALPLNVFKTIPLDVPLVGTEVYETPIGYTAIVLLAQVTNTNANIQTVSLTYNTPLGGTPIVYNYEIYPNAVLTISGGTAGKLVVETGNKLILSGSSTDLKFILSIIETLK
jgi:hypothetical protein